MVVLWNEFWLQSTKTLFLRSSFFMTEVIRFGSCFFQQLGDGEGERRRVLVTVGGVERQVEL